MLLAIVSIFICQVNGFVFHCFYLHSMLFINNYHYILHRVVFGFSFDWFCCFCCILSLNLKEDDNHRFLLQLPKISHRATNSNSQMSVVTSLKSSRVCVLLGLCQLTPATALLSNLGGTSEVLIADVEHVQIHFPDLRNQSPAVIKLKFSACTVGSDLVQRILLPDNCSYRRSCSTKAYPCPSGGVG